MWNQVFKMLLYIIKDYFQSKFKTKFQESLKKAGEEFFKILWNGIKDDVHKAAVEVLKNAQEYLNSEGAQIKKEEIVERVLQKVKLPIILRPFRKLIKSRISSKVDELVSNLINKAINFLA